MTFLFCVSIGVACLATSHGICDVLICARLRYLLRKSVLLKDNPCSEFCQPLIRLFCDVFMTDFAIFFERFHKISEGFVRFHKNTPPRKTIVFLEILKCEMD